MSNPSYGYTIKKYEGLHCFYACVLNQVNYIRGFVSLAFGDTYHLAYRKDLGNSLGERITCEPIHLMRNISSLYKMTFDHQNTWQLNSWRTKPSILELSSFSCRWLAEYQKVDRPHYIIFLNESGDQITFADPSVSNEPLCEETDRIEAAYRGFQKETHGFFDLREINQKELLLQSVISVQARSGTQPLTSLYKHLALMDNMDKEFDRMLISPFSSILNVNLHTIATTRILYAQFLQYINSQANILTIRQLISLLHYGSNQWNILRLMLYRSYLYNNFKENKKNILKHLNKISELEKRCVAAISLLSQDIS